MPIQIMGKKMGMTQVFGPGGTRIPVTVVDTSPCTVVQVKSQASDGYDAVQLGYEDRKPHKATKPLQGHFRKASVRPKRHLRESRLGPEEASGFSPGDTITAAGLFKPGDWVDVTGTTKGRGFTGVMKRHNFAGSKATHGSHEYKRHGGAIGMHAQPAHTLRGHRMAGQYGAERVTVQNLQVVAVRDTDNLVLIRGAIPGAPSGLILIRHAKKKAGKRAAAQAAAGK